MNQQNEFKLEQANHRQIGGQHYKKTGVLQHWDIVALFNLDYFQGNISKYAFRWRDKNGLQDLEKARHYMDKYIEIETARAAGKLTRHILEQAIAELEGIEQEDADAASYRAQAKGDDPINDKLSGYPFRLLDDEETACDDYKRPAGVIGGPCLNCGGSQPAHAHRRAKAEHHSPSEVKHNAICTHGEDDCKIHPNGGCPPRRGIAATLDDEADFDSCAGNGS